MRKIPRNIKRKTYGGIRWDKMLYKRKQMEWMEKKQREKTKSRKTEK